VGDPAEQSSRDSEVSESARHSMRVPGLRVGICVKFGRHGTRAPPLMTTRTRRSAQMSRLGSPWTATKSARNPGATFRELVARRAVEAA